MKQTRKHDARKRRKRKNKRIRFVTRRKRETARVKLRSAIGAAKKREEIRWKQESGWISRREYFRRQFSDTTRDKRGRWKVAMLSDPLPCICSHTKGITFSRLSLPRPSHRRLARKWLLYRRSRRFLSPPSALRLLVFFVHGARKTTN